MYQNKAILIGFLGNDAEVRTGKSDQKFTTFTLATKTSYKDQESGEYVSQITAIGPLGMEYVDQTDDPRNH